ncbi:cyclopropane mycolic acid synthase family methyltransferase [Rhodococcus spongiicola]|uniref:Methyltransferase domain-containing protein n=1 Tax=Rhodococcus spongiicola TaxID=2487352 RepID=A0A3S3DY54_9NOCA|nr:cyclopropane mycolic acid synthase family methyltransferase [Rhodococcus spongiicola]RVW00893.1 methyltransferase domain-containing protein [Rhodococcus spongiicola]
MPDFKPYFKQVQSHYDLSDDFFQLFLDPSMTYSCAYFEREDMTLEQAQLAKIDLSLGKCDLHPGMTLLDIGCGWGSTMLRALEKYDVNVIGLTLSENQYQHATTLLRSNPRPQRTAEVRLQGWEDFNEPVDRIVSIGAFEHFRRHRYDTFFGRCRDLLPPNGRMLLHSIVAYQRGSLEKMGIPVTEDYIRFAVFIVREIFRGAQLPEPQWVTTPAEQAGFGVERIQPLQPHYARTLDLWAAALAAHHDDAVRIASEETYERYMKYLTGAAEQFRSGRIDVMQFSLVKKG